MGSQPPVAPQQPPVQQISSIPAVGGSSFASSFKMGEQNNVQQAPAPQNASSSFGGFRMPGAATQAAG